MLDLTANQPTDVPTRETLMFLLSHLPVGAEILEIGCGEGRVACELLKRGYRVTGLDSDPEIVARAKRRGVPAVVESYKLRQQRFPSSDRLHSFIAPHQPTARGACSRARTTKSERIALIEDLLEEANRRR
jgi:SAM-dependent methyltransferase